MAKINEIDITSLTFQEGTAPATPASTKWKLYTKTDGLYVVDDAGTETGPLGTGGGGGGGAWTYLATQEVTGAAATIEFSSIASTYEALMIIVNARSAGNGTSGDELWIRVGATTVDSGASAYGWTVNLVGNSGGNSSDGADSEVNMGTIPSDGHDDGDFGSYTILLPKYSSTSQTKQILARGGFALQGQTIWRTHNSAASWLNDTTAIDTILLRAGATVSGTGTLEIGSIAYLFGLEAS